MFFHRLVAFPRERPHSRDCGDEATAARNACKGSKRTLLRELARVLRQQNPVGPEAEDYAGALNYLALICSDTQSKKIVRVLRKAKTIERAAKDLLRAVDLRLLSRDDPNVDEDLKKIHKGKLLPPVLLVRGEMNKGAPLIVADGYHRICAVCYYDENAPIPCRMAE